MIQPVSSAQEVFKAGLPLHFILTELSDLYEVICNRIVLFSDYSNHVLKVHKNKHLMTLKILIISSVSMWKRLFFFSCLFVFLFTSSWFSTLKSLFSFSIFHFLSPPFFSLPLFSHSFINSSNQNLSGNFTIMQSDLNTKALSHIS